jgi:hypothetical protein
MTSAIAEKIELTPIVIDGVLHLQDQHGRLVAGIKKLTIESNINDATHFIMEGYCIKDGRPYFEHKKVKMTSLAETKKKHDRV